MDYFDFMGPFAGTCIAVNTFLGTRKQHNDDNRRGRVSGEVLKWNSDDMFYSVVDIERLLYLYEHLCMRKSAASKKCI